MATQIEVTFAKSQTLPEPVPEGRLQLVDESAGATEVEAYVGTQNGAKKITDKDKASIADLESGAIVPKLADNLTPYAEDSGTTQTQPFFLEGTATGNGESRVDAKQVPAFAFLQEKRGNMVCVNQLVRNGNFATTSSWVSINSSFSVSANVGTFTATAPNGEIYQGSIPRIKDHKYLVNVDIKLTTAGDYLKIFAGGQIGSSTSTTNWQSITVVYTSTSTVTGTLDIQDQRASEWDAVQIKNVYFVDLTQWFNVNIPAYLISHPEAFGRYYKGSLAYEPGRLEPATGRYLTSVGRNLFDKSTFVKGRTDNGVIGYASGTTTMTITDTGVTFVTASAYRGVVSGLHDCAPNTYYYLNVVGISANVCSAYIDFYDVSGNWLSRSAGQIASTSFVTPVNAYYYRLSFQGAFAGTFNLTNITITEYYSGESGYDKYYPYEVLATIDAGTESLYSAGSAYDSKVPSGLITRRIGSGNLTGLNFIWDGVRWYANAATLGIKLPASNDNKANISHGTLITYPINSMATDSSKIGIGVATNGNIYVYNNDSTASPTGTIYFELATPTTEQGTPFQENVPIDDFGQLSWSDTDVPQGNQIFYPVDYKAYEDTLIKYTNGDATSLVRKTDYASSSEAGLASANSAYGVGVNTSANGLLYINRAISSIIKAGANQYLPIVPENQHQSVFYALAKAAGANLASSTEETAPDGTNPGVYPTAAKTAIQDMLGITDLIGDINTVLDSVNGVVI